ncbi:MAG: TrkH family potassium uptake protein [Candidatus Bipolaricaulia bacterium]
MSIVVDVRSSLHLIGAIIKWMSLAYLVPFIVALVNRETILPFLIPTLASALLGFALEHRTRESKEIGVREGFLVVSLAWLVTAAFGSLPYLIAGEGSVATPLNAYFEAMSGFTTTGATVMVDIESHSRSILIWRGLTQWLGGMGIIVLALAVLPKLAVGGRQLMEAEAPGPEIEKLTPRIRETARALWRIYVGLTVLEAIGLILTGLSPYDAFAHAFTTLSTGGFSPQANSIATFGAATQWIVIPFMLLGGMSFALIYRGITGKSARILLKDSEFRFYLGIVLIAMLILFANLRFEQYRSTEVALRHSLFQVSSIMTTTGYASFDFNTWGTVAKTLLLTLMFFGGSAGSTGGSIKIVRALLVFKFIGREIKRVIHPDAVITLRLGDRPIGESVLRGVMAFTILYVALFAFATLLIMIDGSRGGNELNLFEGASAVAATLGNVGPGFGVIGPMSSYAQLSGLSKLILTFCMWAGRLEIFPVFALLTRHYWRS